MPRTFDGELRPMRSHVARVALGAVLLVCGCSQANKTSSPGGKTAQTTFDTPEHAVEALFKAASANDTTALLAMAGPDSRDVVIGADPVASKRERQVVVAAMIERWWLEGQGDTLTVVVGNESYPMPIPLVKENGTWRFDAASGRDEVMYRRIGRNELAVIDVAAAFAEAQHEYAMQSHDGVPKGAYAQYFLSDPGKENGLYWAQATPKSPLSPMGELAAKAASHGYGQSKADPYWGYYFKMLTAQGANAPGGAKSWIEGNRMAGGFGMLAWPADYGGSGIMTFMVGPDGAVRQKDLGQETSTLVAAMTTFDPDTSWTRD